MSDIYDLHAKAFARVSAFVILKGGERVATVAIKFPADGAGRLYAYVHWIGIPMVRGYAGGYGYDKQSAAVADAARKIDRPDVHGVKPIKYDLLEFVDECSKDDGWHWSQRLKNAGFTVLQAV